MRFLVTSFSFFLVAGVFALLMRIQLARAENNFLGPEVYNRLFTMHGTVMMYLFAVPFQEGLAALLLPWLLGARDLAYPRLTAFSYWVFLFSGLIFFSGFLFDAVADIGWFAYTPLSAPAFAGKGIDFLGGGTGRGGSGRHRGRRGTDDLDSAPACAGHVARQACRSMPGPGWRRPS